MSEQQVVNNKKEKKQKSKGRVIFEWIFTGFFLLLFAIFGVAQIDGMVHQSEHYGQMVRFGYSSFVIISDSMEPEIMVDDAIIAKQESMESIVEKFNNGENVDIAFFNCKFSANIEFTHPEYQSVEAKQIVTNAVMTHRITEIHIQEDVEYGKGHYVFVCAGINDEGLYSKKAQYQLCSEQMYLGTIVHSSRVLGHFFNFLTSVWGLLIVLLVPAAYLIVTSSIDILKTLKESEEKNANPSDVDVSRLSKKDQERLKKELIEKMLAEAKAKDQAKEGEKKE